jgi:predicted RNA methylase
MNSHRYFEQVAQEWDDMRAGFFSDAVRAAALDALEVETGRVAADLGAGTGFVAEALIARGLSVIAVDQSSAMLAELRRKLGSSVDCRLGTRRVRKLGRTDLQGILLESGRRDQRIRSPPLGCSTARPLTG